MGDGAVLCSKLSSVYVVQASVLMRRTGGSSRSVRLRCRWALKCGRAFDIVQGHQHVLNMDSRRRPSEEVRTWERGANPKRAVKFITGRQTLGNHMLIKYLHFQRLIPCM